jgi:hypothetical protein
MERTQLSQLRTGLSLALIAPSAAATLAYVFVYVPESVPLELISYIFLTFLAVYGTYMSLSSYRALSKTRSLQRLIRKREVEVMEETEFAKSYLEDILLPDRP